MKNILFIPFCFLLASITSCDEVKLDIVDYGSINGKILDGEFYLPVQGVLVTTTPASSSVLTNSEGKFTISKIKVGDVAVNVKKKDYLSNTLSVAIYSEESATVDFLIFKDDNNVGNVNIYDPVPGNGAMDQSVSILLKWMVEGKKASVDLTYSIYMFESNSTVQKLVGEDISVPEVTVGALNNSTTYFWYVVAKYDGNKVAFSPTWSFKTIAK
ncbi:MAG: carboxypeptidase regulatory-like domain-containing protein [Verrucomicrobiota bacterium]